MAAYRSEVPFAMERKQKLLPLCAYVEDPDTCFLEFPITNTRCRLAPFCLLVSFSQNGINLDRRVPLKDSIHRELYHIVHSFNCNP